MESANKSALFVLVVLLGIGLYVGRDHIQNLWLKSTQDASSGSKLVAQQSNTDSKESSLLQGGAIVVEAFGKPYVSENAFNKKLDQMLQASPYTKNMDPSTFPAEAKAKFLKDWVNFLLIKDIWGKETNIENDPVFKKRFEESLEALKDSLIIEAYVQEIKKKISVSDEDVSVEYHSNKDRYVKSLGGANFVVSQHADISSAKALQQNAARFTKADAFVDAAHAAGANNVINLGFVDSRGSSMDGDIAKLPTEVRRIIFGRHSESCLHVTAGGKHYIVFASDRKSPEFFELDEIRSQLKMMLEETKQKDALEKALEEMTSRANLVLKTDIWDAQPRVLSKQELQAAIEQDEASYSQEDSMMTDDSSPDSLVDMGPDIDLGDIDDMDYETKSK